MGTFKAAEAFRERNSRGTQCGLLPQLRAQGSGINGAETSITTEMGMEVGNSSSQGAVGGWSEMNAMGNGITSVRGGRGRPARPKMPFPWIFRVKIELN